MENDKAKIAELIKELDQKKNEALKTAWQKVNKVWIIQYMYRPLTHLHGQFLFESVKLCVNYCNFPREISGFMYM